MLIGTQDQIELFNTEIVQKDHYEDANRALVGNVPET